MCGLFGTYGPVPHKLMVTKALCVLNSARGTDSAGIVGVDTDGSYRLYKRVFTPIHLSHTKKFRSIVKDAHILIGHTRFATHGTVNQRNAHPFRSGKTIMAHNGVVSNFEQLKKVYNSTRAVDSQLLADMLDKIGTIEDARGTVNVTYWQQHRPDVVRLGRSNNPLSVVGDPKAGWYVWSSEEGHLMSALGMAGIEKPTYVQYKFPDHSVMEINAGKIYHHAEGKTTEYGEGKRYSYSANSYDYGTCSSTNGGTTTTWRKKRKKPNAAKGGATSGGTSTTSVGNSFKVPFHWDFIGRTQHGTRYYADESANMRSEYGGTVSGKFTFKTGHVVDAKRDIERNTTKYIVDGLEGPEGTRPVLYQEGKKRTVGFKHAPKKPTVEATAKTVLRAETTKTPYKSATDEIDWIIPSNYIYLGESIGTGEQYYATDDGGLWCTGGYFGAIEVELNTGIKAKSIWDTKEQKFHVRLRDAKTNADLTGWHAGLKCAQGRLNHNDTLTAIVAKESFPSIADADHRGDKPRLTYDYTSGRFLDSNGNTLDDIEAADVLLDDVDDADDAAFSYKENPTADELENAAAVDAWRDAELAKRNDK